MRAHLWKTLKSHKFFNFNTGSGMFIFASTQLFKTFTNVRTLNQKKLNKMVESILRFLCNIGNQSIRIPPFLWVVSRVWVEQHKLAKGIFISIYVSNLACDKPATIGNFGSHTTIVSATMTTEPRVASHTTNYLYFKNIRIPKTTCTHSTYKWF